MMKQWGWAVVLVLGMGSAAAQQPVDGPGLTDLMETLQFAELVRTAALTHDQLVTLSETQAEWLKAQRVPDAVAAALHDVCQQVLKGKATDEAVEGLGAVGRELQQAQMGFQRASQELVAELKATLTPEQRRAMALFASPVRGLSGLLNAARRSREAPQPAWEEMRPHLVEALSGFAGQGGTPAVPKATLEEWLDRAHQMTDAEFAKAAPGLAEEWAKALAPEMMRQVNDPGQQDQRVQELCRRMISDRAGHDLIVRLLAGRPAEAPPAAATPAQAPH